MPLLSVTIGKILEYYAILCLAFMPVNVVLMIILSRRTSLLTRIDAFIDRILPPEHKKENKEEPKKDTAPSEEKKEATPAVPTEEEIRRMSGISSFEILVGETYRCHLNFQNRGGSYGEMVWYNDNEFVGDISESGVDRTALAAYPDQEKAFSEFIDMLDGFVEVRNSRDKMYLGGFNTATMDAPFLLQWFNWNRNERYRDYFHMQILDMMTVAGFALMDQRRSMQDFKLESVARQLNIYSGEGDTSNCVQNAKTSLDIYRHMRTRFGLEEFPETPECTDILKNY